jgi:uncharacterized C2H2 Zn-finger protein
MTPRLDPNEAPAGYFAALKADAKPSDGGNICRACDWRPECSGLTHRCMSYAVISSRDGSELKRRDGCSVVFKRKRANTEVVRPEGCERTQS